MYINKKSDMLRILLFLSYSALATTAPATSNDPSYLECGPGWNYDPAGRSCYKLHLDINVTWEQARTKCIEDGGNLASIHHILEQHFVSGLVENIDSEKRLWIGGYNTDHKEGWQFSDCTLFDYSNWGKGEPNNDKGLNEWCAEMLPENGQWNDAECGRRINFLCKKPSATLSELPVLPSNVSTLSCESTEYSCPGELKCIPRQWLCDGEADCANQSDEANCDICRPECGPGWNYYDSFGRTCYKMDLNSRVSWNEARVRCSADGGDLASIDGNEEQTYIANLLENIDDEKRIWIGAYYISGWQWSDGTLFNYTHWLEGEPNNKESNEWCVEMHPNAEWNDEICNKLINFLCEKPSAASPPLTTVSSPIPPMSKNNLKGHKLNSAIIAAIQNIIEKTNSTNGITTIETKLTLQNCSKD